MNVSLTPELDRFIARMLAEGTYASQSEVVRAGLRLLIEREEMVRARIDAVGHDPGRSPAGASPPESPDPSAAWSRDGETLLPPSLLVHFPDYDVSRLSLERDRETIIGRLLGVPHLDAVRWLRAHVPDAELGRFLRRRQGRGMDPKGLRFWGVLLELPSEEVDAWVEAARRDVWRGRGRP